MDQTTRFRVIHGRAYPDRLFYIQVSGENASACMTQTHGSPQSVRTAVISYRYTPFICCFPSQCQVYQWVTLISAYVSTTKLARSVLRRRICHLHYSFSVHIGQCPIAWAGGHNLGPWQANPPICRRSCRQGYLFYAPDHRIINPHEEKNRRYCSTISNITRRDVNAER